MSAYIMRSSWTYPDRRVIGAFGAIIGKGWKPVDKIRLRRVFDKQAARYAAKRESSAMELWRRRLLSHAKGEVLELAVGAGANFPFYPSGVKVTAVDFSEAMLEKARQAAHRNGLDVAFLCADMEEADFPARTFDTVVSTLSLCSYGNPSRVLESISRWCKPGGDILLLEHGISSNPLVSAIQRTANPLLYRFIGCHHTRDIPGFVRDAGMTVVESERYWFGMMYLIRAKPKPGP